MTQYLSLYRKFRPKTFDEVIGQSAIVSTLSNQIKNGEIGHAYLFTGTRGTGKTSCAKIFAKAVNCLHPKNGSPCGACENCKALENANMDIIEIDAASNNSVEDIRDMRENIRFAPAVGKFKVYIIDEVHMLSINAFNALLKSIEEPPAHIIFILATTEVHKIPATILSRVQRLDFKLVSNEELEKHLRYVFSQSGIEAEDEAVAEIARCGNGSVRDTLSTAECVSAYANKKITYKDVLLALGKSDKQELIDISNAIINADINSVFTLIENASLSGKNINALAKEMSGHFRDLLICKTCVDANSLLKLPNNIFEKMKLQADNATNAILIDFLERFNDLEANLRYAENPKMLLEVVSLSCVSSLMKLNLKLRNEDCQKEIEIKKKNGDENAEIDALQVWGKVVKKLHEDGEMVLHTFCGACQNVEIENGCLILKLAKNEQSVYDKVSTPENKEKFDKILKDFGYNLTFNAQMLERQKTSNELRLEKLANFFGDYLTVYED